MPHTQKNNNVSLTFNITIKMAKIIKVHLLFSPDNELINQEREKNIKNLSTGSIVEVKHKTSSYFLFRKET